MVAAYVPLGPSLPWAKTLSTITLSTISTADDTSRTPAIRGIMGPPLKNTRKKNDVAEYHSGTRPRRHGFRRAPRIEPRYPAGNFFRRVYGGGLEKQVPKSTTTAPVGSRSRGPGRPGRSSDP